MNKRRVFLTILGVFLIVSAIIFIAVQRLPVRYDLLTFYPQSLPNSNVNIYFSESNNLYKASLNGLRPKKVTTVLRKITSIVPLKNGDVLVHGDGRYMGKDNKLPEGWSYESEGDAVYERYWIIKHDKHTPQKIDEAEYNMLSRRSALEDYYYTKELPSGGANIILEKNDGSSPVKVGYLKDKVDEIGYCDSVSKKIFPRYFTASFDGSYLLSSYTGGGGGICSYTRGLITSDGKVVFNINRNSNSVAWIGNDKLMLGSYDKSEIITLKRDGTFESEDLPIDLKDYYFEPSSISPSKELLLLLPNRSNLRAPINAMAAIYNINDKKVTPIKNLQDGYWIGESDRLLVREEKENNGGEFSRITTISVYDPKTKIYYKIATFPNVSVIDNPVFVVW